MNSTENYYKQLKKMYDNPQEVLVIHWSRQNINDNDGGFGTPRIIGIVVCSLDGTISRVFAIHLEAEKAGFTSEDIETYYDQLEESVLNDFNKFAIQHSTDTWIHWDSSDPHIGFEAVGHRYKVLLNKGNDTGDQHEVKDLFEISVQNRINLNSYLKEIYGANYEKSPQLMNLIKSNYEGVLKKGILPIEEEARSFQNSKFPRILQSMQCNADFLKEVMRKTVDRKLKVSNRNFIHKLGNFFTHPIMIAIAWICTIISLIFAIA